MLNSNPDSLSFLHTIAIDCARCGGEFNIERANFSDDITHCPECIIILEEQAEQAEPVNPVQAMASAMDAFISILP